MNAELNQNIQFSDNLTSDTHAIIEHAQISAYKVVDTILIQRNWLLGKRIAFEILKGEGRAEYGEDVINRLSKNLTATFGKGFTKTNLYSFVKFSEYFPNIFHAVSGESNDVIFHAVSGKLHLSWTHYRTMLQVSDQKARDWYEKEASREMWSSRTLQRNIASQYYYRMLKTYDKEGVHDEMMEVTSNNDNKLELLKSPIIAEFLGLGENTDYLESTLENAILTNLQKFLMEMGKGYAWVARQQHIHTEKRDYYIDLVFYNIILKCYVLIDLKTTTVTHQDVGQMDMYIRMYDELKRTDGDNPTIGIILCSDTDDDIARFSVLKGNEQLFASKYLTYMPTKEQLREEIERQRRFYLLQKDSKKIE